MPEQDLKTFDRIWFLWLCGLAVNIITLIFIRYKIHPTGQTLALHYNVVFGVDWYGAGKNLYSIPIIGFLIFVANFILFRALRKHQIFLSFLCALMTLFVQIILFMAVVFLARVN